ncbi:MAG TPA: hypothetical protein VLE99_04525 [Candidatus Saccharimonadales bacterium]|nr:hypothetical protein [Candidatus Saccharimonadales bacterium]
MAAGADRPFEMGPSVQGDDNSFVVDVVTRPAFTPGSALADYLYGKPGEADISLVGSDNVTSSHLEVKLTGREGRLAAEMGILLGRLDVYVRSRGRGTAEGHGQFRRHTDVGQIALRLHNEQRGDATYHRNPLRAAYLATLAMYDYQEI